MLHNTKSKDQYSISSSTKKPRIHNYSDSSYTRTNIHPRHKQTNSNNMDICDEELELEEKVNPHLNVTNKNTNKFGKRPQSSSIFSHRYQNQQIGAAIGKRQSVSKNSHLSGRSNRNYCLYKSNKNMSKQEQFLKSSHRSVLNQSQKTSLKFILESDKDDIKNEKENIECKKQLRNSGRNYDDNEEEMFCSINDSEDNIKKVGAPRSIHSKTINTGKDSSSKLTVNHAAPTKNYRITEQDVYNQVRNNVYETFKTNHGRNFQLIKELTENFIINDRDGNVHIYNSQKQQHKKRNKQQINRLCEKYSIIKNRKTSKKKSFEVDEDLCGGGSVDIGGIDIEGITRRYVISRSKDKQKEQDRQRLKRDIADHYRYGRKKQYMECQQFFSLNGNDLKKLQKKYDDKRRQIKMQGKPLKKTYLDCEDSDKQESNMGLNKKNSRKSTNESNAKHPYLQIYEKAQMEAMLNLQQNKTLSLNFGNEYPTLPEPEEWQKNSINIQKIFNSATMIKKKREIQSARSTRRQGNTTNQSNFFLT